MTSRGLCSFDDDAITAAEAVIRPFVRHTPMLTVDGADFGLDQPTITFKLENLQRTGSFKVRGAFANLLMRDIPPQGVIAASGGNHGAAVAFAAAKLGVRATIFVPEIASPAKTDQIKRYGATLVVKGRRYTDALSNSQEYAASTGALSIHAFEQAETILGQATVGVEIERIAQGIDTLLVAVGGGGLIAGLAAWYGDRVKLVAVEPASAPTLHQAFQAGRPVEVPGGGIAADSLAPERIGELAFGIVYGHVDPEVVLVEDSEIEQAQGALWTVLRTVVEPGGAVAFAALTSGRYRPEPNERVAVLICGGNVAVAQLLGIG